MKSGAFTTCLWFDTEGEAAATYYTSIFPGSRLGEVSRYNEAGPGQASSVMTVEFEVNGQQFIALNGGPQFSFTEAISLKVPCADQDEIDYYWSRLGAGGEEGQCGWLKDKYGLSWQVVPVELPALLSDPDPARAQRAMAAMLTMTKFDIAALRKASDG